MLKKVFKHEWHTISPLLLAIHIIGLSVAVICRIGINLMGGVQSFNSSIMAVFLLIAAIIAIGCVMVFTYFYTGYRFYKSVFAQQGYLTNTLPVTADQLIWGKGFTGVIWLTITFLWAMIAFMILVLSYHDAGEFFSELPRVLASLFSPGAPAITRAAVISLLLTPFFMIIQLYVSAAVGNLFTGHKLLASAGVYLGLYFLQQIAGIVIMCMTAPHLKTLTSRPTINDSAAVTVVYNTVNYSLIAALIFSILFSAVFYFLCRYVLNHRLNLE